MCRFHMVAIIRRKMTKKPQLEAGKELLELAYRLKGMDKDTFVGEFEKRKEKWHDFLKEKTVNEVTGSTVYTHQRLRPWLAYRLPCRSCSHVRMSMVCPTRTI